MKKVFLIILITFLTQCGYTSLYQDMGKININIKVVDMKGDNQLNNLIRTELQRYQSSDTEKNFLINVESKYTKKTLTKDKTGNVTTLRLTANVNFDVTLNENKYKFSYEEGLNINKSSNSNEQSEYEDIVKRNFTETIRDNLILKLIELK